ncbi:MAG: sugar ABC transporter permease [Oscillospiraceae bacterium]|nr:sugar ABC transporter permease [Oscillospiraceae bacterium]
MSTTVIATKKKKLKLKHFEPYILLIPAVILIATLILFPIGRTFAYSFQELNLLRPNRYGFVGFDNFRALADDVIFHTALQNSIFITVIVVFFQFLIGLTMALLMKNMKRCRGFYRAMVFAPWAVSGILVAVLWRMIFSGTTGVANDLMLRSGLIETAIPWGANGQTAMIMVIVASVWRGIPFFAITIMATLTTIPEELYESARIDGGGAIRLFFSITMPFLRETIVLTTMLRFIWTFNDVDLVFALTAGGPNNATLTLPVYVTRTAVEHLNFGYGSTLAIALAGVLLVFSIIYLQLGRTNDDFSA